MALKKKMTHLDRHGAARMVDVGEKDVTNREATAEGELHAQADVLEAIFGGDMPKGDAIATARVAAIMAAKRTHELIPLCHPLPLTGIAVDIEHDRTRACAIVRATVRVASRTGVEMEALTAVSVGLLALYDMAKSMQKDMRIQNVRLRSKSGGRSGDVAFA